MGSKFLQAIAKETLGALTNLNRAKDLPKAARPLLKGRTDPEVSNMIRLAPLHDFLAGLHRKTYGPRSGDEWFPGANKKLSVPVSELDAGRVLIPRSGNYEAPVQEIPWERLQGGTVFPLIGDRTATGTLKEVGGVKLPDPVDLQGGKNYMRGADEGAWASEAGALKSLTSRIPDYENPYGVFMPMAGTGSDFAHMTTDVLHQLWSPAEMTKKGISAVNKKLKTGKGVDGKFPDAPSIDTPEFMTAIEVNSPLRKAYVQALDDAKLRDQGGPDMGVIRHAVTDPDLMHVRPPSAGNLNEQMMGFAATDLSPTANTRPSTHRTYDTDLEAGDEGYLGALPLVPRGVLMRDWTRMRRGESPDPYGDPRSLFTGPARAPQPVDQETIDAISAYEMLVNQSRNLP